MTTIFIDENSPQAKQVFEFIKTLPYVTVVEETKQSFEKAAKACNAVTIGTFINRLADRIKKRT